MKNNNIPLYAEVYELLKNRICTGVYPKGSKLPSKRILAESLGVSLITVVHALELLCDEDYIASRERSGNFVIYSEETSTPRPTYDRGISADAYERRLITMQNEFPTSVYVKKARGVLSEHADDLLTPSNDNGLLCLRQAIADYLGRARDISVDPSRIFVGSGARSLYIFTILLCGRDKRYAIEDPSYDRIERAYTAFGIDPIKVPLNEGGISTDVLSSLDADLLHVTPYYSYPSGISTTSRARRDYTKWARAGERMLIEDDFGSELCKTHRPSDTLLAADPERVIYINSFSKTISPAVRAGYAVVPEHLCDRAKAACEIVPCAMSTLDQYLLTELIRGGDLERSINRMRKKLKEK